jgi:uncharacterized protein (TIGR04255 family)
MKTVANLKIDLSEPFPHLSQAPIVEAVIAISGRASVSLEEASLLDYLKAKLPGYSVRTSRRAVQHTINLAEAASDPIVKDLGWNGIQCKTSDGLQIVDFGRDGFAFSRLHPYENWDRFKEEALRLWVIYAELAKPMEIQRAGLRFINKIMFPVDAKLEDFLTSGPRPLENLPLAFAGFLMQYTFMLPEPPFCVQVTQTIQPVQGPVKEVGLILDIDTFTGQPFEATSEALENRLSHLRWLKNKAFFGSLKPQVLEKLK